MADKELMSGEERDSTAVSNEEMADPRIMIVDDNELNLMIIRIIILKIIPNVALIEAHNGEEAVGRYETDHPELIFMDVHMPVMNGYEAAVKVRELETGKGRRIPIIAITAGNEKEERDKCIGAGMDDIIIKPIGFENVKMVLEEFLNPR